MWHLKKAKNSLWSCGKRACPAPRSQAFRWAALKWLGLGAVARGRQSKQRETGSRMRLYYVSVWGGQEVSLDGLYTVRPHCWPGLFHFTLKLQVNLKSQWWSIYVTSTRILTHTDAHTFSQNPVKTTWRNARTLVCQCFLAITHSFVNRVNKTVWMPTLLYFQCCIKQMYTLCAWAKETYSGLGDDVRLWHFYKSTSFSDAP